MYILSVIISFSFLIWSVKVPNLSDDYKNLEKPHSPIGLTYGSLIFISVTSLFNILNLFACLIMLIIIFSKADVLGYKVVFGEDYKDKYRIEQIIINIKTFLNKKI
jgi:hypothetical protein